MISVEKNELNPVALGGQTLTQWFAGSGPFWVTRPTPAYLAFRPPSLSLPYRKPVGGLPPIGLHKVGSSSPSSLTLSYNGGTKEVCLSLPKAAMDPNLFPRGWIRSPVSLALTPFPAGNSLWAQQIFLVHCKPSIHTSRIDVFPYKQVVHAWTSQCHGHATVICWFCPFRIHLSFVPLYRLTFPSPLAHLVPARRLPLHWPQEWFGDVLWPKWVQRELSVGRLLLEYGERDVPLILGWPCCEDLNMRLPEASCHSHREPTPDETGTEENSREKEVIKKVSYI